MTYRSNRLLAAMVALLLTTTVDMSSTAAGPAVPKARPATPAPPKAAPAAPAWQSEFGAGKSILEKLINNFEWDSKKGNTLYDQVGDLPKVAEDHLRKALSHARAAKADDFKIAEITYQLAQSLWWQQQYLPAKASFEEAKKLFEKAHPGKSVEATDCLVGIAGCMQAQKDHRACEDMMIDAYEDYLKLLPHDDKRFAQVLPVLGGYTDDVKESVDYYKHLAEVDEKNHGPNSKQLALSLSLYAAALARNRQHEEASKVYERVSAMQRSIAGEQGLADSSKRAAKDEHKVATGEIPEWDCEPRYYGRRTRRKLGISDANAELSPRESDRIYGSHDPRDTHKAPELPETPDESIVPKPAPKRKIAADPSAKPARYTAGGKEISKAEYDAVMISSRACDLIAARKYSEALTLLESAQRLAPECANVHCNMGLALAKLGRRQEGIEHLKKAVAYDSEHPAPLGMLGSAYQGNGMLREAILTYREFVKRFPGDGDMVVLRAMIRDLEEDLAKQLIVQDTLALSGKQAKEDYAPFVTHRRTIVWSDERIPIKIYIEPGDRVPHYKPEFKQILLDCFREWSDVLAESVKFVFVSSKEKSDIDCFWTNDFSKVSSPAEGGEAQMRAADGKFKHCTIVLLTEQSNSDLTPNENDMRALCLHEIGHTLGLVGHSPDPNDIMFCTLPSVDQRPRLTSRDVHTVQSLYKRKAAGGQSGDRRFVSLINDCSANRAARTAP